MRWHDRSHAALAAITMALLAACSGAIGDSGASTNSVKGNERAVVDGTGAQSGDDAAGNASAAAGATGAAGNGPVAGNGFIVIRSTGPSASTLTAGKRFGYNAVVTLAAGDRLVLTDGHETRTLAGPGRFNLSTSVPATGSTIGTARDYAAALGEGRGRSEVGGTRRTAAPGTGRPENAPAAPINSAQHNAVLQPQPDRPSPGPSLDPQPRPRNPLPRGTMPVRTEAVQADARAETRPIGPAPVTAAPPTDAQPTTATRRRPPL